MECNNLLQNVTEYRCLIQEILQNAEAKTAECYKNDLHTDLGTYIQCIRYLHSATLW